MSMNRGRLPRQGETWLVDFSPTRGAEISKRRPAVVVSDDMAGKLPLRIVVPVTDWKARYAKFPWFTEITPSEANGLSKTSGADGFQVKSVSCDRFIRLLGRITARQLEEVQAAIVFCLGLP